jgi:hypothetical protein
MSVTNRRIALFVVFASFATSLLPGQGEPPNTPLAQLVALEPGEMTVTITTHSASGYVVLAGYLSVEDSAAGSFYGRGMNAILYESSSAEQIELAVGAENVEEIHPSGPFEMPAGMLPLTLAPLNSAVASNEEGFPAVVASAAQQANGAHSLSWRATQLSSSLIPW